MGAGLEGVLAKDFFRISKSLRGVSAGSQTTVAKAAHCSTSNGEPQKTRGQASDHERIKSGRTVTLHQLPRARTPVRHRRAGLVSDEVREKVSENSEQGQTADAVAGEYPGSAAFMMPNGGCAGRGLLGRGNDRGPIFHAKNLRRKDRGASTLCVTPASRLGETGLSGRDFTPDLSPWKRKM